MNPQFEGLLPYLIAEATTWAASIEQQFLFKGQRLSPPLQERLAGFFESSIIANTMLVFVEAIQPPPFYSEARKRGIPPYDFASMEGMTFNKCVLVRSRPERSQEELVSLCFHELVHVVQYDLLGIAGFMKAYIRGWAENDFIYERIPLEVTAYKLQERFVRDQTIPFSVRAEVQGALLGIEK